MNYYTILLKKGSETEKKTIRADKFYLTNDSAIVFEDADGNDFLAVNKDSWIVCSKNEDV